MTIDIVCPCYNEQDNINKLAKSIKENLKNISYKIIFVDDGSTDNTLIELEKAYKRDKTHISVISFSRNFGKDAALYAAMKESNADYLCIIDSDLQQNPKYIKKMLNFLEENNSYDQVAMVNNNRIENKISIVAKKLFYNIIDKLSDIKFVEGASDFRLMRHNIVEAVCGLKENSRFSKGIFSWVGFNTYYMEYKVEKRNSGTSKFSFSKNIKYAMDGIIGFSTKPLRISTIIGLLSSIISFILLIEVLIEKVFFHNPLSGYTTVMCAILFLGGIQLITIGILGEYLAKTYLESKKRPAYIIRKKYK